MKFCPECAKEYTDAVLNCEVDGVALLPSVRSDSAPVQVVQLTRSRGRTGLYIAVGMVVVVAMVLGFIAWAALRSESRSTQQEQAQAAQAELEQQQQRDAWNKAEADFRARMEALRITTEQVQLQLDRSYTGELAQYLACGEAKLNLYRLRQNAALPNEYDAEASIPTANQIKQNLSLAAQSSVAECRKEVDSLQTGKPSFDCGVMGKKYLQAEEQICSNKTLAQLDVIYRHAVGAAKVFAADEEKFKSLMRTGLAARNNCESNTECIASFYRNMTATLNEQVSP